MKLNDIKPALKESRATSMQFDDLDIWSEVGLSEVNVSVTYEYEASSYSDHPYGEGTAREVHPAEVNLISVKVTDAVEITDEDNKVVEVLPVGTDLMDKDFWKKSDGDWLIDKIIAALE